MPLGAIVGDFVGARFERHNIHLTSFPWTTQWNRFTDDTVLTLATCAAILNPSPYIQEYRSFVQRFPNVGYGPNFQAFVLNPNTVHPPASPGNGAAMRVSPIGWAWDDLEAVLREAERSARASHDHPAAIAGAQAVSGAVCILRQGASVADACALAAQLGIPVTHDIAAWRGKHWSSLAVNTVPVAFAALRQGQDFETTVRLAVSAGGDSDTIASMAGAMAEAYWGIPKPLVQPALHVLAQDAPGLSQLLQRFRSTYRIP